MQPTILRRRVVVARAGRRHQSDLLTHSGASSRSNLLATRPQVRDDLLDAKLVDDAHALRRHAQPHEAPLALEPEALRVQIRQKTSPGLVVGVGDVVARGRALPGHLTDSRHFRISFGRRAGDYTVGSRPNPVPARRTGLDPAPLRERHVPAPADDDVVEQAYVDEREGFRELERDAPVRLARLRDA